MSLSDEHTILNYADLREKAIGMIQQLAGDRWTDHNIHDPGITILEQLCYALTDLSYRTGFSIPDLMAQGGDDTWPESFFPEAMLSSGPIRLEDWRKLLIDVEGVRDAWIYPMETQ